MAIDETSDSAEAATVSKPKSAGESEGGAVVSKPSSVEMHLGSGFRIRGDIVRAGPDVIPSFAGSHRRDSFANGEFSNDRVDKALEASGLNA